MAPPARWGDMDSPVKPANDAKGVGGCPSIPPRHSSESWSPGRTIRWIPAFAGMTGWGVAPLPPPFDRLRVNRGVVGPSRAGGVVGLAGRAGCQRKGPWRVVSTAPS